MSQGSHGWVLLDSEEAHAQVVGDFVTEGVQRGECVLLVGIGARIQRLRSRLHRAGLVGETWTPSPTGPVRLVPPDPDRVAEEVAAALADGHHRVRFSAAIEQAGVDALEPTVTRLTAEYPMTALCPYFRGMVVPGEQRVLATAHDWQLDATAEYDDGVFRLTRSRGLLGLAGELDSGNADGLRAVLRATLADGGRPAAWDVADLRFLDVGAADSLLTATAGPPGLTVLGASRLTARLVSLLADRHPDLAVDLVAAPGEDPAR